MYTVQAEQWYNSLAKPDWTPSADTIGLIWSILYPIIAITFCFVFYKIWKNKLKPKVAIPFAINLIANLSFSPILFNLRNLPLATLDAFIILFTIIWSMAVICNSKKYRWISIAQIPYLTWVSIAASLQTQIWLLNLHK